MRPFTIPFPTFNLWSALLPVLPHYLAVGFGITLLSLLCIYYLFLIMRVYPRRLRVPKNHERPKTRHGFKQPWKRKP